MRNFMGAAAVAAVFATSPASALTLVSNAAGYAGTTGPACSGDSGAISIEITYTIPSLGLGGCQREGIVEFDLAGVATPAVTKATLTLFNGQVGNSEGRLWPVDVYGYIGDGVVTGEDFQTGSYLTSAVWDRFAVDTDRFAIDVTDFVNARLAKGTPVIGFNLRAPDFSASLVSFTIFIYFNGGGQERPPTLELTPVPVPGGFFLLGSATAVLVGTLRSKRKLRLPVDTLGSIVPVN